MRELRQSTAITIYPIGPALDPTSGTTAETAIECSSATIIDIYQANGTRTDITTTASGGSTNDMAHMANGYYYLELTGTDTSILGPLRVTFNETTALPFWEDFMILTQAAWDAKYVASKYPYSGTSVTNIIACFDGTGYNNANSSIGSVTTIPSANLVAGALSAGAFAANAITASALAAGAITSAKFAGSAITASAVGATAIDIIWDELRTGHAVAGSYGADISILSADSIVAVSAGTIVIISGTKTTLDALTDGSGVTVTTNNDKTGYNIVAGALSAGAFAVSAITASALAAGAITNAKFAIGALTGSAVAATAIDLIWDEARSGHAGAGSYGIDISILSAASIVAVSAGTNVIVVTNNDKTGYSISGTKTTLDALTDGSGVTVITNNDKTGYNIVAGAVSAGVFAGSALTASAFAAGAIDLIWDEIIEGTTTGRQSLMISNSILAGKVSGGSSTTATFRDVADTKNRVVIIFDEEGDRSSVTLTLT